MKRRSHGAQRQGHEAIGDDLRPFVRAFGDKQNHRDKYARPMGRRCQRFCTEVHISGLPTVAILPSTLFMAAAESPTHAEADHPAQQVHERALEVHAERTRPFQLSLDVQPESGGDSSKSVSC
jgi:hypothetical protein